MCSSDLRRAQRRPAAGSIPALPEVMTACTGMTIRLFYEEWAKKGVLASDMETAALFVVGRIRGMRTASILNVVAACKGNVAENIGRYVDGETLTAQGEEYEILTAFAALTRQ